MAVKGELVVRVLEPPDAQDYAALRVRALTEHPDAFTSSATEEARTASEWSVRRLARNDDQVMLGALVDRQLVGTAGLVRQPRAKERHKAGLYGMFVAPEYAGQGIGRKIVIDAIAHARQWPGLEQIVLTVTHGNERARRLYLDAGFVTFGIERRAIKVAGVYHDKEHMVLFLE